jgi:hypothetical protein
MVSFSSTLARRTVAALALAGTCAIATAETGSFACIAGSSGDCAYAASTLSWSWNGSSFTITNNGSGYVSEVYFDLSGSMAASFTGGVGTVSFSSPANPAALPGGTTVGFTSDIGFDSDTQGPPVNGINNGESATFTITNADLGSIEAGTLGAGVHVRSLPTSSASLVTAVTAVPEPETYALMIGGLAAMGFVARRRKR